MKGRVSQTTQRVFPLTMICAVYRVARSSVYAVAPARTASRPARKPGPKTRHHDGEVVDAIRAILAACPFHGEGYRKIRARLAHRGLHLGGKRVLRLMGDWITSPSGDDTTAKPTPRHWSWARLMQRAFEIDVLACPRCGGRLRLIATVPGGHLGRGLLEWPPEGLPSP